VPYGLYPVARRFKLLFKLWRRIALGASGLSFSDPIRCRPDSQSTQDKPASEECFSIAVYTSQASQSEKSFGIEPLLRTLAP
jgi:hypothetical protein